MNELDFSFESAPWEALLEPLSPKASLSAVRLLAALEGEDEDGVEQAFEALRDREITLDFSDFPKAAGNGEAAARLRQEEQLVRQGKLLTDLPENDPLRLFLEELAGIPTCGDVQLLALDYSRGREENAEKLANLSLSRVTELAQSYVGRGVLLMDLIQEGSLGLWQGILEYTGGNFEAHRDWWIHHYLEKAVLSQALSSGVGQKLRQAVEDYRMVDERLLSELGRNPTLEEIALEMHISPEEAAVEDTAYFQMRQRISELLSVLPEEDAKLLTLRFGLEGELPLSPEDTGKRLGLTPDEVVAREGAALAKLRNG